MAGINASIRLKSRTAVDVVTRLARVRRAYIFGSHAEGTADCWSDIDIALFVDGLEQWTMRERANAVAMVQKEAGDDMEVHFFPAESIRRTDPAGFAAWIINHGVELQ